MTKTLASLSCLLLFIFYAQAQNARIETSFNSNWKFYKGEIENGETETLNDKAWRTLDVPHDWSIENLTPQFANDTVIGPFSKKSIGGTSTGHVVGGTAWYRKHFKVSNSNNRKVAVYFDGIYMNSDVWINGHHLGNHPYGYTPFSFDLTMHLKPAGAENTIAVRVRNEGKNSRWYSGSGIYRNVWLTITHPVHVQQWGVYITTPKISATAATVNVTTALVNKQSLNRVKLRTSITDKKGQIIARVQTDIAHTSSTTTIGKQTLQINTPSLWSPQNPYLYTAVTDVLNGNEIIDHVVTNFGVRSIEFSAAKGFLLNDKKTLLRGGCVHHDNGPLGAAAIDRAEERKIEVLKSAGYNAIRTSHNPPSQALLNACDRLGMLVIDEAFDQWQRPKNPQDYHLYFNQLWQKDLSAMVLRDRNHPSVILWSIGNEINERADSSGLRIRKELVDEVHKLDPGRPVTEGICDFWEHKGYKWDTSAAAFAQLDVGGYNYMWQQYEKDHAKYSERIMVGTESLPKEAFESWQQVEQHPWVIGDFVWTAMDYMGEVAIGHTELDTIRSHTQPWPWYNAYCGDIDLIGGKKPQSWYRDVVWRQRKMAMLVHAPIPEGHKEAITKWGWPDEYPSWNFAGHESKPLQVNVYTRYSLVRLVLNGKTIGEKPASENTKLTAAFTVNYYPGVLKAVGIQDGRIMDSVVLYTTGAPKTIRLTADRKIIRANRNDVSYVTVEVLDANGLVVPDGVVPVYFSIAGQGEIAATGNANPSDMASFQKPERNTFRGRCLVIVRPKGTAGKITLKAEAGNLVKGELDITVK